MPRQSRRLSLLLAGLLCAAVPALADELDLRFSGYGTLAATYADTTEGQYRASWRQSTGSRGQVDMGVDSRLGGQVNATFDDTWSAAAQLLALRRDGQQRANVEWLYGQVELGDDLSARVGRLALPAFMLSDVRNVGYAQHWVRPPTEVYLGFPITSVDGAQLLYTPRWQGIKFTVQPAVGQADARFYFDGGPLGQFFGPAGFRDLFSLNLSAQQGPWTARLGRTVTRTSENWVNMAALQSEHFTYTFTSVGLQYDNSALLIMAEWVNAQTSSGRFDTRSHYVSAGYRFGDWLPYATYAHARNLGSVVSSTPPPATAALGMRWDLAKDVALKAQAERSRFSGQQFIRVDLATDRRSSASVYTLALEFVF